MGNGVTKDSARRSINGKFNILTSGGLLKTPWRQLSWNEQNRFQLLETIKAYKPLKQVDVRYARILFLGHVNVGKSSFFNTVNSIFRNHVTAQAPVGSPKDQRSITNKLRAYQIRDGREGRVLNFRIVDTMGIEGDNLKGFNPNELPYVLDGHVPDCYRFDPAGSISSEMPGYNKFPSLQDKTHCCVLVLDANKVSSLGGDVLGKMADMRVKTTNRGIPLIVLLTKIDQACSYVGSDVSLVYKSVAIRDIMAMASAKIGIPVSHVLPIKNYTRELELDAYVDVLVLSAVQQMLRFTDNHFDECLVHTDSGYVQPESSSNDAWSTDAAQKSTAEVKHVKQAWSNKPAVPSSFAAQNQLGSIQLSSPLLTNNTSVTDMQTSQTLSRNRDNAGKEQKEKVEEEKIGKNQTTKIATNGVEDVNSSFKVDTNENNSTEIIAN